MFDRLPAWGMRATWAQQNGFEALTLYAPACLLMLVAALHGPETNPSAPMAAALLHLLFSADLSRRLRGGSPSCAEPLLGSGLALHSDPLLGRLFPAASLMREGLSSRALQVEEVPYQLGN